MSVPFDVLESSPKMSAEQYAEMRNRNTYRAEKGDEPKPPPEETEPDHEY
jgi:hypothetical protein